MLKKLAVGIAVGLAATSAQASDWLHCGDVFDSQSGQLVVLDKYQLSITASGQH